MQYVTLAEGKSDGLLMAVYQLDAKQIQRIKSLGIPVVLFDPVGKPGPDLMTVGAANWDGAHSATEHMLQLGHRRIGVIGGREDLQCSNARKDGYISALRRAGIPVDPALIVPGDFTIQTIELGAALVVRGSMAAPSRR